MNLSIKRIIITFPFNIQFIAFSFNYFFYSKFFLISFLQFFFIKTSNNFFTIKIINYICPWNCIFNFFNYKNFFRPIWCVSFSKNIFVLRNSYMITNFKFRIFLFESSLYSAKELDITSIGFIFMFYELCYYMY